MNTFSERAWNVTQWLSMYVPCVCEALVQSLAPRHSPRTSRYVPWQLYALLGGAPQSLKKKAFKLTVASKIGKMGSKCLQS